MNRRVLLLLIGSLSLSLGCAGNDGLTDPAVQLAPSELCSDHSDADIATFEDAILEGQIREALSVGPQEDLTCGLISGLTELDASFAGIESLVGIQNLTSLTDLLLGSCYSISDISPLSGLTSLTSLYLDHNSITDIGALSGLTSLTIIRLNHNSISDISALSGLTSLTGLGLDHNSITDIGALSGLTSLTILYLHDNLISDIGPLSGLTSLTRLWLDNNSITDISAVSGLTSLTNLLLTGNPGLSNIQPLFDNTGLGAGDAVGLRGTSVSCTDVAALQAKGVAVSSDC
jgi:internalin A